MPSPRPGRGALATAAARPVTAVWGSTFFLIRDLVATSRRPTSSRCGSPSPRRDGVVFRRQTLALTRRELLVGVGARRPLRRGPAAADRSAWRTPTPRCRGSSPAPTSCSPRCSARCCCATGSRGRPGGASAWPRSGWRCCPCGGLSRRLRRGAHPGLRRSLYALHIIGLGPLVDRRARPTGLATVQAGRHHRGLRCRRLPGGHHAARRPAASGPRCSTWRWSPARWPCGRRPGRSPTCRPPGPRSS